MAIRFDSATEHVAIADNAKWTITPVTNDRAYSFFYRPTVLPPANGNYHILGYFYSAANRFQIALANNGGVLILLMGVYDASWAALGGFYTVWTPTINSWYHAAINLGANEACSVYLDCASQAVTYFSWDDATEINPSAILIGGNGQSNSGFGDLAHVAWWDKKLTLAEIVNIRNYPWLAATHANCMAYFPFDEGAGTLATDRIAHGSYTPTNGTLTNSPTWVNDPPLLQFFKAKQRTLLRR
jgi:hypothetical protein